MAIRTVLGFCAGVVCALLADSALSAPYRNADIDYVVQVFSQPYFKGQQAELRKAVHVVTVLPVDLGDAAALVPHPQAAQEQIERLTAERLAEAGIKVTPATAMRELMAEARASAGDLYDTHTGQPHQDRINTRSTLLWDELRKRNPADAYLVMSIVPREAQLWRNLARWDGIEDSASGHGIMADSVSAFLVGPTQQYAAMPALSLAVWLIDSDKSTLYANVGGLHLGAYVRRSGSFPEYLEIAPSDALVDPSRVTRALDIALDPALPKTGKGAPRSTTFPQAAVAGGPAPGAPPFVTSAQFRAKYKKIALTPVIVPGGPRQADLRQRYESIIQKQLQAAGFDVVGSETFMQAWMGAVKNEPDLFDGQTGRANSEKLSALRAQVGAAVHEQTRCDALLSAAIFGRPALFLRTEAHWLGASQIVTGDSTALAAKLGGGANRVGSMPATALRISVVDPSQVVLYEGMGGIELRARLEANGSFTPVPLDKLFADPQRDETAVSLALANLLTVKDPH